jgi:hypothetical protein
MQWRSVIRVTWGWCVQVLREAQAPRRRAKKAAAQSHERAAWACGTSRVHLMPWFVFWRLLSWTLNSEFCDLQIAKEHETVTGGCKLQNSSLYINNAEYRMQNAASCFMVHASWKMEEEEEDARREK